MEPIKALQQNGTIHQNKEKNKDNNNNRHLTINNQTHRPQFSASNKLTGISTYRPSFGNKRFIGYQPEERSISWIKISVT